MRRQLFLIVLCFFLTQHIQAKTARALIIGINIYKPPTEIASSSTRANWRNLGGCINDAEAIKDVIIAKYSFQQQNISTLYNQEASREKIISEIKKLISISEKGDVVFVFYAGHGSQVVNSLSVETDKKDETIVPADAYGGAADIRDKELAGYFNELIDKGVLLTVIFDSCHSGSVSRGSLYEVTGTRFLEGNPLDVADSSDPKKPEERGALIISAAQDFEFAKEINSENNVPHGAFTLALLKALRQNSVDASTENIFSSLKAIMKYFGKTQEPVLAGNQLRKNGTLFGLPKGAIKNRVAIAISKTQNKRLELMGGYALGLSPGIKLKSLYTKDTILVTEMISANRSWAKIVSAKNTTMAPGTLFEIVNWSSSVVPALKIYLPQHGIGNKELAAAIRSYQELRDNKKINWIDDIARAKPERVINFSDNNWWYINGKEGRQKIGATLNNPGSDAFSGTSAFVNFPAADKLVEELKEQFKEFNNIQLVASPEMSMYTLVGRVNDQNKLSYAFVKTQVTIQDSSETLPARTDFEGYDVSKTPDSTAAGKLAENAFRIAKIKDWLMLQSPQGQHKFPFSLAIQNYNSGKSPARNQVSLGDTISFFFKKNINESWNRKKRYVYVFSIDAQGAMKLLFPMAAKGNVENRLPLTNEMNTPQEKSHLADILVKRPLGFDNYFMLTTEEAIDNLSAFQQAGVISRGANISGSTNPLQALLFTGAKSRNKVTTPLTWSIEKLILKIEE